MPDKKKADKEKKIKKKGEKKEKKNINKNKNKNIVTVNITNSHATPNVSSHSTSHSKSKGGGNKPSKSNERYPPSYFGLPPPQHIMNTHVIPENRPQNVKVDFKASNPITHGIGDNTQNGTWTDPNIPRDVLLQLAADAAEYRKRREQMRGTPNKGKGKIGDPGGGSGDGEEDDTAHNYAAEGGKMGDEFGTPEPPNFKAPDAPKPNFMNRVPEIFGFMRGRGDGASSSRTPAHETPESAHAPDPDHETTEDFEGTKKQILEYIFHKFGSIEGIPPIEKVTKAQLQIIAKATTLEEGLRKINSKK
jgi:hypothetical protein